MKQISGFSKLSKIDKISWLRDSGGANEELLKKFWLDDSVEQKKLDELSENTVSNFLMPYGIAPNFNINEKMYTVPMVIEESSVVAAASKAAKFWLSRGGFNANIVGTTKLGHVHFFSSLSFAELNDAFNQIKNELLSSVEVYNTNMRKRGGGILSLSLIDRSEDLDSYFQLEGKFETCDAMGANFINTMLEGIAANFKVMMSQQHKVDDIEVNMSILSNYTPECLVEVQVDCAISELAGICEGVSAVEFAQKFKKAIDIARIDTTRAVTHNKGILNGIDSVVLATGNDFRAVEASCHAYATRDGKYRGLSECLLTEDRFTFKLAIPLAIGTVGGLTSLHPLAKESLELLDSPDAAELMRIIASVGLAQNFGAISSLVTTGIQKGHMKMHLLNILNQLEATETQVTTAKDFFKDKIISFNEVRNFLNIH